MQSLRLTFHDIGVEDKLVMHQNGRDGLDYFDSLLSDIENTLIEEFVPFQPVILLLLDINMPILSGIEALKLIKDKYQKLNARIEARVKGA